MHIARNVRYSTSASAADRGRRQAAEEQRGARPAKRSLPKSGYFADVDPSAEVRPAAGFLEKGDLRKRPGRYQSDFIWNTDWQSQLDREAAEQERKRRVTDAAPPAQSGGLGLARMLDLDRMDVDLSSQLRKRTPPPRTEEASRDGKSASGQLKPYQADSRRWQRSGRFTPRAAAASVVTEEELLQAAAAQQSEYEELKQDLQRWTLAFAVFGCLSTALLYSRNTAISFTVGAFGSILYLRMLNRSIEGMTGGGLGGALGQPRLLIPIVLALGYNRWNQFKAGETGVALELLPMLLGFFVYKAAVVGRQAGTLLGDLAKSVSKGDASSA